MQYPEALEQIVSHPEEPGWTVFVCLLCFWQMVPKASGLAAVIVIVIMACWHEIVLGGTMEIIYGNTILVKLQIHQLDLSFKNYMYTKLASPPPALKVLGLPTHINHWRCGCYFPSWRSAFLTWYGLLCAHTCTSVHTGLQSGCNDAPQERGSLVVSQGCVEFVSPLEDIPAFLPHSEECKSCCIDLCRWPGDAWLSVCLSVCVTPGHLYIMDPTLVQSM